MKFYLFKYPEGIGLQQRMFLLSLYVVGIAAFLLGLRDIALRGDWVSGAFEITAVILSISFYILFRKGHKIDHMAAILVGLLFPLVSAGCILGRGGLSAGNMMMFVIVFIIMIGTVPRRWLTLFSFYAWGTVLVVAYAELQDPGIRANYKGVDSLITSDLMIFTVSGIAYFLILELTRFYRLERNKNIKKNQELQEKNKQIEAQAQSLREMNEFKTKLFAILGHDMMSPLQGLSSILDFIRNKLASPEEIELMLPSLTNKVQNTTEIINNLFDWSRISLQDELLHHEEFLLKNMVDRIIENVTTIYTEKQVDLVNQVSHDTQMVGDAALIETIIRNLVRNAIKYSNNGGLVTITYSQDDQDHVITVSDRGIGMSQETLDQLFKFEIESKPGTKGEVGKGLGLFLCKEFVKAHGGEIQVDTTLNEGSKFSFNIPIMSIDENKEKLSTAQA